MKTLNRLKMVAVLVTILAALGIWLMPTDARAQINEFVIGVGAEPDTLDPVGQTTGIIINMMLYTCEPFFWLDPDTNLVPLLATSTESSPDGLTYVVKLRKGVTFHDGTPFNAAAVKWNIDRLLDPKTRVPLRAWVRMFQGCSVVDDYTVKLTLKHPYLAFDQVMSFFLFAPISPSAGKKYGKDIGRHPVGTGPYKFVEWVPGQRIVMERNEDYWAEKPAIKKIVWKIVPEAATREAMLVSGDIDLVYKPSPSSVPALKANPAVTVASLPTWRNVYMAMNCQKGVFKNKLVRQAFNYAVDKKAICKKVLFDLAVPVKGPMSPAMFGYAEGDTQYDYNPEKAKELLKKANFDFSQTIHMATPHGRLLFDKQVSEAIQAYLQAIGVKVELRVQDWPTHIASVLAPLDKTRHEISMLAWCPLMADADLILNGVFTCRTNPPKGLGIAFYCNPELDKLVDRAEIELDKNKRKALLQNASRIVWEGAPWIFLHQEKIVVACMSKYKGLILAPYEMFFTHWMTLAK